MRYQLVWPIVIVEFEKAGRAKLHELEHGDLPRTRRWNAR